MRLLVFALVPLLLLGLGYVIGRLTAEKPQKAPKLSNPERKELQNLRDFKNKVLDHAMTHALLDSPLATIIIDTVREHDRKELE